MDTYLHTLGKWQQVPTENLLPGILPVLHPSLLSSQHLGTSSRKSSGFIDPDFILTVILH